MTPAQFSAALVTLHWTQRGLATLLGADDRQVRRWAAGYPIPASVASWLAGLAAHHVAAGVPEWRVRKVRSDQI